MKPKETEILYRTLFEQSPYGILIIDYKTGKIVEFNDTACIQLGYTRDEFAEMQIFDLEAAETPEETKRHIAKIKSKGRDEFDTKYRTNSGEIRDYQVIAEVIEISGKKLILSIHHDITEHLKIEQNLKENEERYRSLVELSPDAIFIQSEGKIVFINSAGAKLLGANRPEQLLGKSAISLVHPTYRQVVKERISKTTEKGTIIPTLEEKYLRLDGTAIDVEVKSIAFSYKGKPAMQVIVRDITERKKMEEDLKLRAQLLDDASDFIFLRDLNGNYLYANETALKTLGYSREEFLNLKPDQVTMTSTSTRKSLIKKVLAKDTVTYETASICKDGSVIPVEAHSHLIEVGNKKLVLGISRDISERKKAEEELKLNAQLLDSTNDAIILHDLKGNFIFVNDTTCKALGYTREEIMSMKITQLVPAEQAKMFKTNMQELIEKGSSKIEVVYIHKNGSLIPMEINGRVIEYRGKKLILGVLRDITERKQVAEELKLNAQLLDSANDAIILHDLKGNFVFVNETACKFLGYTKKEFMSMKITQLNSPEQARNFKSNMQKILEKGTSKVELTFLNKRGTAIPMETHGRVVEYRGRKLILSVLRDISERKASEDELMLRAQLLDNATDFIFLRDLDGKYAYVNETALKALGYSREEFMKLKVNQAVASGYTWVKGSLMEDMKAKDTVTFESYNKRKDGSMIPVESHARLIESGGKKFVLSAVRDISERKKLEESIKQLAYHDPLTGLPNRTLFNDHAKLALAQATRYNGKFALLMMDLDKFKKVNDTLGHDIGDHLLKEISNRLLSIVRKTDTVTRIGGDEFVLLISELTNEEDAANVAKKILDTIRKTFVLDGNEINISTSIGFAVYPEDGKDIDILTKHADFAMYTIKRGGRNGYMRYTPDMENKASRRHPSAPLITKQKPINTDI